MLVLSRRNDESIVIGNDIIITIIDIRGDKVRLGIEAPKNVTVHRREVWEAIQQHQLREQGEQRNAHATEPTAEAEPETGDGPAKESLPACPG